MIWEKAPPRIKKINPCKFTMLTSDRNITLHNDVWFQLYSYIPLHKAEPFGIIHVYNDWAKVSKYLHLHTVQHTEAMFWANL